MCRNKTSGTDSANARTMEYAPALTGAAGVRHTSVNGGIQNGGGLVLGANGKVDERKRKKIEKYSLEDTAETTDLTTMENTEGAV